MSSAWRRIAADWAVVRHGRPGRAGRAGRAGSTMRAALAFLTRIPVGVLPGRDEGPGAAWFGVVGAAIGLLGAIPVLVLGTFQPWAAAVLAVAIAAIVSGALHLDGLADTADALAPPDPQRADLARRDPRTGPAGVAAVVLVLLLDVTALAVLVSPSEWGPSRSSAHSRRRVAYCRCRRDGRPPRQPGSTRSRGLVRLPRLHPSRGVQRRLDTIPA